jgi:ABC-2 type transport system ATP-binding protein
MPYPPKVLFLDEPTLDLDAQTRGHICDYVKELNKEEAIIIKFIQPVQE